MSMHKKYFIRKTRLALAACLLLGPVAFAPAARAAESAVVSGHEIVVTATRAERESFNVPSSVDVVDNKEMGRTPRGTIAEQLQDVPGIEVTDGGMGGGAKRVQIRGESPARVLILIDGMKISEQKSMEGSMIMIDPLNVERVEVIKGPASVLYGSEAIGGVVNIITKKGGDRPVQGAVAVTGDTSNDSISPYLSLYGAYEGFSYRAAGDYTDAGDKRGSSEPVENSGYRQRNASAYLDYAWTRGKAGFGYDHFWSRIHIPGADSGDAHVELDLPKWQRDRYYGFLELNQLSDRLPKIRLVAFVQETRKDFYNDITVNTRTPAGPGYMIMDVWQHPFTLNEQRSYGGTLQADWTVGDHYLITGADYLYDDLKATDDRLGRVKITQYIPPLFAPNVIADTSTRDLYNYEAYQQTLALFVQDEWTFHPDWTLTAGLRFTLLESSLHGNNNPALSTGTDRDSHPTASLGLVYAGLKDWRLRLNYAQGYRYPLLNQLYIGTTHGGSGTAYPNPKLKPETSQNFEAGARYSAGGLSADLSLYYNRARNYISMRPIPGTSDAIFSNVGRAETGGAELTLGYTLPVGLEPYLSGAYMRRVFD
ncbi:MAG: TonB-dependent receptor, partial [Deltaproteobacteria bacterium]|nr:TonB-dependent receptor [Deltaproteobacteria bacterium]